MNTISILILDDILQSLNDLLYQVFNPFLVEGELPTLEGGTAKPFIIKAYNEDRVGIEITSNTATVPSDVTKSFEGLQEKLFDIVLIDDDWGSQGTSTAGQRDILCAALERLKGSCEELPTFVLFTRHWDEPNRMEMFRTVISKLKRKDLRRVSGFSKSDFSSLMLLIQRTLVEKTMADDRRLAQSETLKALAERDRAMEKRWSAGIPSSAILPSSPDPDNLIGDSIAMKAVFYQVQHFAPRQLSVLLSGETGVGKELIAKAIHKASRKTGAFVARNCGQWSSADVSFVIADLFGYTPLIQGPRHPPATRAAIELAEDGTLFLDEVHRLPRPAQDLLIRFLNDYSYTPLQGGPVRYGTCRIIVGTGKPLTELVDDGVFDDHLLQRLYLRLEIPPLREHADDIPLLAEFHNRRAAALAGLECPRIDDEVMMRLKSYEWPGNIRELERFFEQVLTLGFGDSGHLTPECLVHLGGREIQSTGTTSACEKPKYISNSQDLVLPEVCDKKSSGDAIDLLNKLEKCAMAGRVTFKTLADREGVKPSAISQQVTKKYKALAAVLSCNPHLWAAARSCLSKRLADLEAAQQTPMGT